MSYLQQKIHDLGLPPETSRLTIRKAWDKYKETKDERYKDLVLLAIAVAQVPRELKTETLAELLKELKQS